MAVKIQPRGDDDRVRQILADPKRYFEQARVRARADVEAEVARERDRRRSA